MKTGIMDAVMLKMVFFILVILVAAGCDDDSCTPVKCDPPPLSVLSVDVTYFQINVIWMHQGPDQIESRVTLRIENLSSKYSYSDISFPSARVYRASDNHLLGEIRFETDWDGSLDASEIVTVELVKIEEDSQIFPDPCDEYLYLDITITSPGYGELKKGTPTYLCSCLI
jgi:hypothetical protein